MNVKLQMANCKLQMKTVFIVACFDLIRHGFLGLGQIDTDIKKEK